MELPPSVRSNSEEEEGGETMVREQCGLCCLQQGLEQQRSMCIHIVCVSHTHTCKQKKKTFAENKIIRGYHLSLQFKFVFLSQQSVIDIYTH